MSASCDVIAIFLIYDQLGAFRMHVKVLILAINADFLPKNADSKLKGILALRGIFSKTSYMCVLMYQFSSF